MVQAPIPHNEHERLAALHSYDIIDTLQEDDYDDLTKIAAQLCNTPIATITFIDEKRQVFKAKIGLENNSSPREESFCAHAINTPDTLMEVTDSRLDARFADNPLVEGNQPVIFYAGFPLVSPDGYALGTICVIDHKPNKLSAVQVKLLRCLSRQVVNLLELRKKNKLLSESQAALASHAANMENFAYMVSHDLKEPVRNISTFIDRVDKNYSSQLDPAARKYIQIASDGAKRMKQLIDDMLVYAQQGVKNSVSEPIDTGALIEEIINFQVNNQDEFEIQINYSNMPVIQGHRIALRIVFQNLIANAVKYAKKNTVAVVSVSATQSASQWVFAVQDNGIGINNEDFLNVFKPFTRLDTIETYSGTGLGLTTCKKIIESHGGQIWVESEPGKGSTFYFSVTLQ